MSGTLIRQGVSNQKAFSSLARPEKKGEFPLSKRFKSGMRSFSGGGSPESRSIAFIVI